jgi:iron complex outermembrane receptor protein
MIANPPFPATRLPYADSFVDGNLNLQWDVARGVMAYVSYGHGTKTGGYAETNSVAYPVPADPARDSFVRAETTDTEELGVKSELFGRRLQLNADVFNVRVHNFQNTTFTGAAAGFITENLPLTTSRGAEVSTAWQANNNLRVSLATVFANAENTLTAQDYLLIPGLSCQPCRAPQAPRWNGTADIDYVRPLLPGWNWRANLHARYRDAMFNQSGETFPSRVYVPIDLGIELQKSDASRSARLYVKNMNNSLSEDFASPSVAPEFAGLASPAPLRTLWLTVQAKF